jgi:uncharacterized protein
MKIMKRSRVAGSFFLVGILLFVGGCGFKDYPIPPDRVVPKPIEDLRYTIDEKGVNLTWSYPMQTIQGSNIEEISSFELYRAVVPLDEYCAGCPIPFGEAQVLPGGVTVQETRRKGSFQTSLLRSGHKYFFKVRSRTSWWASSEDSNIVSFIWHTPAKAPEGLKVKVGEGTVFLQWSPANAYMDGRKVDMPVKYQILRSRDGQEFEAIGEPVSDSQYIDRQVAVNQKYHYKVQSVVLLEGNIVNGGTSEEVNVVTVDLTPPVPPTGVAVISVDGGVKVFWEKSTESDLAGYRVYRRASNQETPVLLGEVKAGILSFIDSHVPADIRVYYSVTAFDKAQPANESQNSREATLRH